LRYSLLLLLTGWLAKTETGRHIEEKVKHEVNTDKKQKLSIAFFSLPATY
jgi:hypothetical protein